MELIGWIIVLGFAAFVALIFIISFMDMLLTETSTESVLIKEVRVHYFPNVLNGVLTPTYRVTADWRGNEISYDCATHVFRGDRVQVSITRGKLFGWFAAAEELQTDTFNDTEPRCFDSPNDWWDSMDRDSQNYLALKVKKSAAGLTDDEIIFLYVTEYNPPEGEEHHSFAALKFKRSNKCKVAVTYFDKKMIIRDCIVFLDIRKKGESLSTQIYVGIPYIHILHSYEVLEYYNGKGDTIKDEYYG